MDHTYAKRKPVPEFSGKERASQEQRSAAPVTSLHGAPEAGSAKRLDLSDAIRTKMENAFGTDLSAVRLYESEAVAAHGAGAVAQGDTIAFAPGMHDFGSRSGQEILGHELSHVVSQRRGEVTGSGFLNNAALEARADREGALAAAGGQVYDGPVTGPMSGATADASAAGPMQAWGKPKKPEAPAEFTGTREGVKKANKFFGTDSKRGAFNKWRGDLTPDEYTAVRGYTGLDWRQMGAYYSINLALRMMKDGEDVDTGLNNIHTMGDTDRNLLRKRIHSLDSAMAKAELQKPIVVHRGSDGSIFGHRGSDGSMIDGLTDPAEIMKRFGGRVVRDKGFTSTSAVKGGQFARDIHFIITVPPGKGRGAFIAPISQKENENEFLLNRGSSFLVKKAYRDENAHQTVVEMEVQDAGATGSDPSAGQAAAPVNDRDADSTA